MSIADKLATTDFILATTVVLQVIHLGEDRFPKLLQSSIHGRRFCPGGPADGKLGALLLEPYLEDLATECLVLRSHLPCIRRDKCAFGVIMGLAGK